MPVSREQIGALLESYRPRLERLICVRASEALFYKMNLDDIFQELYLSAYYRIEYINASPEVPLMIKLRTILLQTLIDLERRYLAAQKRAPGREASPGNSSNISFLNNLADSLTSPSKKIAKLERAEIVRCAMRELSPTDQEILILRHFEQLSAQECSAALNIDTSAMGMRYLRALRKLKSLLESNPEFQL